MKAKKPQRQSKFPTVAVPLVLGAERHKRLATLASIIGIPTNDLIVRIIADSLAIDAVERGVKEANEILASATIRSGGRDG